MGCILNVGNTPLALADANGQCPLCGVIGAVVGAIASGATAYFEGADGGTIAFATITDAATGALAGFSLGAAGELVVGAVAGAAGNVAGQEFAKGTVDPFEAGEAGLAGFGGALAGLELAAAGASEVGTAAYASAVGVVLQGLSDYANYEPTTNGACP